MIRRVVLIVLIAFLWVRPVAAQTEKYANNPFGGAQATLATTITSGGTSIIVSSATLFPTTGTFTILIETEYIICTSVSGTTFTCPTRGSEGSTAAAHTAGVNIFHVVTDRSLRNNPLALTTAGDLPYLNGSFAQARLGIGATGYVLTVVGGLPAWVAPSSGGSAQNVDLNGVTTFAATSTHIVLTCTGPESLITITGAVSGGRYLFEHDDTDCTITDDDDPTASNAIDLTGSATNDQGATHKLIELFYNGTFFKQLSESDN